MPNKWDLECDIIDLKRKLDEKNKILLEKERKLGETEKELGLSKNKLAKLDTLVEKVKEKMKCLVCLEIPRKSPVPVCPNGHFVCEKCKTTDSCPSCRVSMGQGKCLLAAEIIENIHHKCSFNGCGKSFYATDLPAHETDCPHKTVSCSKINCPISVSLAKLEEHLINSPSCYQTTSNASLKTHTNWSRHIYLCLGDLLDDSAWHVELCRYACKEFVIYPFRKDGQYFFVILMLDSEEECSKFRFEMIIHGKETEAFDSENVARFKGCPLSVDSKKEERYMYVVSNQLMRRIFKDSKTNAFSLSFKLTKCF